MKLYSALLLTILVSVPVYAQEFDNSDELSVAEQTYIASTQEECVFIPEFVFYSVQTVTKFFPKAIFNDAFLALRSHSKDNVRIIAFSIAIKAVDQALELAQTRDELADVVMYLTTYKDQMLSGQATISCDRKKLKTYCQACARILKVCNLTVCGAITIPGLSSSSGSLGGNGAASLGDPGATGFTGATGIAGDTGLTGFTGAQGSVGAQGAAGQTGLTGPTGSTGLDGARGLQGPTGAQGDSGTTGLTGPIGSALADDAYGYFYYNSSSSVGNGSPVPINVAGTAVGMSLQANGVINIVPAGTYKISFAVAGNNPNQFGLSINGAAPDIRTVFAQGSVNAMNFGEVILTVGANTNIQVVNVTGSSILVWGFLGSNFTAPFSVSASVLVRRIA
ncbi:hypothetical protein Noda2021_07140 [Candidatus Dependentiae bacterium Noda2021]|nr:hypothetical protein Noda2021_07140 [Candidatus Dependentiae bacterium Noda2021]